MSKREDKLLVQDIIENIENVFEFTKGLTYEQVVSDKMRIMAVVRCLEIIGEATSMASEELRITYPLIEWREMKSFRNRLIHEYFGIDYETVWEIIQNDIPFNYELLKRLKV